MAGELLLTTIVPALGAVISTAMYAAPLRAVQAAMRLRCLGELNPVPFVMTITNSLAWLVYGLLKHDPYITTPNAIGPFVAVHMTMAAYGLADDKVRLRVRLIAVVTAALFPLLGVVTTFAAKSQNDRELIWGTAGNVGCFLYYGAPLSVMLDVIRARNAAAILLPLMVMQLLNSGLWTTYGLAKLDAFVAVPNGVGLLLCLAQLALRVIYPTTPPRPEEAPYTKLEASCPELEQDDMAHTSSSGSLTARPPGRLAS